MFILSSQLGPSIRPPRAGARPSTFTAPSCTSLYLFPPSVSPSVARPQIGAQTDARSELGGADGKYGKLRDEILIHGGRASSRQRGASSNARSKSGIKK